MQPGEIVATIACALSLGGAVAYMSRRFGQLESNVSALGRSLDVVRQDVAEIRSKHLR